jgi:cell division septation protein DedD
MYQDFFNKNDDYLDEFKQKVANQKIATLEERRTELARSRNNFMGTFAGIVLAGIVGWFVLGPRYAETNKEIPIIRRPQTAVKIKPENPGGMEIPNQDKDVYNIVEKKNVDNTVVENLLPTPETPKLPDIVAEEEPEVQPNADSLDEIVDAVENAATPQNAVKETSNKAKATEVAENGSIPDKPTDLLDTKKQAAAPTPTTTAPKEAPKAKPETAATTAETAKSSSQLGWQIQLVVSRNKDAVEKTWTTLSAKYTDLKKYQHEVQTSDLGAQGTFYRLRAGSFASKNEAAAVCASLKAKGLADCIAKER